MNGRSRDPRRRVTERRDVQHQRRQTQGGTPECYPLPRDTRAILTRHVAQVHPGLGFQRFVPYGNGWTLEQQTQKRILDRIVERNKRLADANSVWQQALAALQQRAAAAADRLEQQGWRTVSLDLQTTWRLVLGLGSASVLEGAGMTLHRLYGFPYIPGSSVKGLVRSYRLLMVAESVAEPLEAKGHAVESLTQFDDYLSGKREMPQVVLSLLEAERRTFSCVFGSQGERGRVVFWDALPVQWPVLEVDITNVHYRDYYMSDAQQPSAPGDYLSPTPIYFLTVGPNTTFRFWVLAKDAALASQVGNWLEEAVWWLGIGAKTRAGYGQLSSPMSSR